MTPAMLQRYAARRAEPVLNDFERIWELGVRPVQADLLVEEDHVARHDYRRLAQLVLDLARQQP
jgi:hypothetical protein